jgi:FKBP12-rapamycin complex-associated protein
MRVMRDNRESLMAVLEAFVYDPLFAWKLGGIATVEPPTQAVEGGEPYSLRAFLQRRLELTQTLFFFQTSRRSTTCGPLLSERRRRARCSRVRLFPFPSLLSLSFPSRHKWFTDVPSACYILVADGREVQNEHAIKVIRRIQDKLHGRDFKATVVLPVDAQVEKLIEQATSVINLCQCFIGWCAFVSDTALFEEPFLSSVS